MPTQISFGLPVTRPMTRAIIIVTSVISVLAWFLPALTDWLSLIPAAVLHHFQIWRLGTYMLLHAGISHLVFNMLALWFFADEVEERLGREKFLLFYVLCGFAGAVITTLLQPEALVVGASGAIMGVMVAYAVFWPDRSVLFMAIFPIAAKWLVAIMVGIDLVITLQATGNATATLCHLGGALCGFLYLKLPRPAVRRAAPVRRHLEVVRAPVPVRPPVQPSLEPRVDAVLDKIAREGMTALSPQERDVLDQASRRLRSRD